MSSRGILYVLTCSTAPGCKRTGSFVESKLCDILFLISFDAVADSGFLESLYRSNVTLNFDGIAEIVENGIITKTGV